MLDQISRSLPPMLWLTGLKQGATPTEVVIDGRCTTMTGLSDFVANLEGSGFFKRGVEIIQSQTEAGPATRRRVDQVQHQGDVPAAGRRCGEGRGGREADRAGAGDTAAATPAAPAAAPAAGAAAR